MEISSQYRYLNYKLQVQPMTDPDNQITWRMANDAVLTQSSALLFYDSFIYFLL